MSTPSPFTSPPRRLVMVPDGPPGDPMTLPRIELCVCTPWSGPCAAPWCRARNYARYTPPPAEAIPQEWYEDLEDRIWELD